MTGLTLYFRGVTRVEGKTQRLNSPERELNASRRSHRKSEVFKFVEIKRMFGPHPSLITPQLAVRKHRQPRLTPLIKHGRG